MGLLLNDTSPCTAEDLADLREHKWTFKGVESLGSSSRGFYFFTRCLLDLQRNVQFEDADRNGLDPKLLVACTTFVRGQVRDGQESHMYHMLTHFLCNAVIFEQWERFISHIFRHQNATQETFLQSHVEQFFSRFCVLRDALNAIFGCLDNRFVWKH